MSKQENKEKKWNVMKYGEIWWEWPSLWMFAACHHTPCIRAIVIE